MSAIPKLKMTDAEYLAMERASDTRHEFFYGDVFAMAGASEAYNTITMNAGASLHTQLRKRDCRVYQSDMRLKITSKVYTYPDVMVVCGEPKFSEDKADTQDTLLNPTLIIEVLSPSTEAYDRGTKFLHYQTLASLQTYVMIAQYNPRVEIYTRQADDQWVYMVRTDLAATIDLASIQCTLTLADIYEKITFEDDDAAS
jgi:Uma2 family endonuclease